MNCQRCGKENPAEVHTCTPLALKLADELDQWLITSAATRKSAAAELRRLHDEVELQQCSLNVARQMIEGYVEWIRKDEALLRQALEALEDVFGKNKVDVGIINALRERLK